MTDKTAIYLTMSYLIAMQSKDKRTQIGSVIVGPDDEVRSTGYNRLPREYYWFEHSERNAIYNAARMGLSTKGCTLYTMGIPCADCARVIIQSGINKVIVHKQWNIANSKKWVKSSNRSKIMFQETNVELIEWDGDILYIEAYQHGKKKPLYNILVSSNKS